MDFGQYGLVEHDLAFLKQKLDNSELIVQHGNLGTTGELVAYTPATGYTFYHVKSLISVKGGATNGSPVDIAVSVQNDGSTIDMMAGTSQANANSAFWNESKGVLTRNYSDVPSRLVGNSTKKFKLNVDTFDEGGGSVTIYGTLIGYIEAS